MKHVRRSGTRLLQFYLWMWRPARQIRLEMAKLLVAWEAAKLQAEVTQRNRAESRLGVQQRLIEPSEHQAMRTAVEQALGTLRDKEVPAKQVIAAMLEQIESNMPVVMMLIRHTGMILMICHN